MNLFEAATKALADLQAKLADEERHQIENEITELKKRIDLVFGSGFADQAIISVISPIGDVFANFADHQEIDFYIVDDQYDGLFARSYCSLCGRVQTSWILRELSDLGQLVKNERWRDHQCDGSLMNQIHHAYISFSSSEKRMSDSSADALAQASLWLAKNQEIYVVREHINTTEGDEYATFTITLVYGDR